MPETPIRAVLFDLDGTLLDTLADIAAAMNTVLERHGFSPHSVDAYRSMVGSGLRKLAERAAGADSGDVSAQTVSVLAEGLREEYSRNPVVHTRAYPGVPELLDRLERQGTPKAVLSNKADALVQHIVQALLNGWEFWSVSGLRDGTPAKPDPTSALESARALGAPAREVLYLGDSDVDMETARRAGMVPVGAAWGFRGPEELRAAGAVEIIDAPGDLLSLIDGANDS